ncbi:unnamed protein product [Staurois parvus]|uniref:Uncharacterized protein n=1 Tax=Staurois parvus TaxID=386267 RepID=A0ABN9DBB9_9NEOB|nr:unnamed protein product [Staurois parvus]
MGGLTIWKLRHCLGSVGGPMRCPGTFFIGFFEFGQGHGPHDPLLPGGPMSCQSAPGADWPFGHSGTA